MKKLSVDLTLVKETKGALRYQEVTSEGHYLLMNNPKTVIGTVYLRKQGIPGGEKPLNITVTIEENEQEG